MRGKIPRVPLRKRGLSKERLGEVMFYRDKAGVGHYSVTISKQAILDKPNVGWSKK